MGKDFEAWFKENVPPPEGYSYAQRKKRLEEQIADDLSEDNLREEEQKIQSFTRRLTYICVSFSVGMAFYCIYSGKTDLLIVVIVCILGNLLAYKSMK